MATRHPTIRVALGLPALFWLAARAPAAELPDFAGLVERAAPTIVEVLTVRRGPPSAAGELEELLRRFGPGRPPEAEPDGGEAPRRDAIGSGFIVSGDGYIVTNNHVVAGAERVRVTLNDRRVFDARTVGLDEPSDLALLKIEAEGLPRARFGDSDALRVGEWVLAIGSPFGLEFSAAAGIVSAKGRSMPTRSAYNYMSFIQSDVAINQGNSGGPLFNLDGEVVGINSQIFSRTGGSIGLSFSIPSNAASNVVAQLRESGHVSRGLLGVRMREVTHALAEIFGLERPRGAFVDEVQPGGPAEAGGIRNEDIVLEFNGHAIEHFTDLPFYVGQYSPGAEAEVLLHRDGGTVAAAVRLGSSPTNQAAADAPRSARGRGDPLGARVVALGEEARRAAGVGGVRVAELDDGAAQAAGLREGDIIVALDRRPVTTPEEFARVAGNLPESGFAQVRIIREGQATTLALELSR